MHSAETNIGPNLVPRALGRRDCHKKTESTGDEVEVDPIKLVSQPCVTQEPALVYCRIIGQFCLADYNLLQQSGRTKCTFSKTLIVRQNVDTTAKLNCNNNHSGKFYLLMVNNNKVKSIIFFCHLYITPWLVVTITSL